MEKALLLDVIPFDITPEKINESITENNGRLIVNGVLQRAESKNQNGRVYPKDDDKDEDDLKLSAGMSVVKENYWHYRNDESLSTKQKLAKSMTEIRNRITEIERLVKYNVKLKNEMRFESAQYMKRTKTALGKISEKLIRLSTKVKDLV